MDKKTNISIGFLFSEDGKSVALMPRKFENDLLLTGIGGHVDFGETFHEAMIREFYEETSVLINEWDKFCVLEDENIRISFFKSFSRYINKTVSAEGESPDGECNVIIYQTENLNLLNTHPNTKWLIPLALDKTNTSVWIAE
jgi:8-oxo-dGTP pyrophosphatase MutT (NUDIX family)